MKNTSKTILDQIGNKNLCLFGAYNEAEVPNGVSFKLLKNQKKITDVKIELNLYDTYNITFYNIRGAKVEIIKKSEDIFADQLADVISINTKIRILY